MIYIFENICSLDEHKTLLSKTAVVYVYLDLPWAVTFDQFEVFAEIVAAAEAHFDDFYRNAISNRTQVRAFDAPIPVLGGYLPGKGACITRHVLKDIHTPLHNHLIW